MIRTDRRLRLCAALILMLLVFIWGNSLMPAKLSQALSNWLAQLLGMELPTEDASVNGPRLLRKIAHFLEFGALGFCFAWLFGMLDRGKLLPLLCGTGSACIDETIQLFIPNRGPGVRDVFLDSFGVLTGMVLLYAGHTYFKKRSAKLSVEDKST